MQYLILYGKSVAAPRELQDGQLGIHTVYDHPSRVIDLLKSAVPFHLQLNLRVQPAHLVLQFLQLVPL